MLEFIQASVTGFPPFIIYFGASALIVMAFAAVYVHVTPYSEIKLIRAGNTAAAASLSGAVVGFSLPLAHAVAQSHNLVDMLIWGGIGMVVQLLVYVIARIVVPDLVRGIPDNKVAHGVFLGAVSIVAGILNAACMSD